MEAQEKEIADEIEQKKKIYSTNAYGVTVNT
jgi:hypothetical protein